MLAGNIGAEDKFVMSGYIANLMTCTPTWQRIGVKMHDDGMFRQLVFEKRMKEKYGDKGGLSIEDLESVERREIILETNPAYIKARVTRDLVNFAMVSYSADWTVIRNETDHPFITSDNPLAYLEQGINVQPTVRYLPMTPGLCLEIVYDTHKNQPKRYTPDELKEALKTEPSGKIEHVNYNRAGVKHINRVVAQNAEDLVFARDEIGGHSTAG